ncbi:MAG: hypothetical protein E6Q74_02890 [Pseudoxanthomonas sp.]|nr:MAG: hypothetical protein E6Q74_02890 [Pseudoxanthomonas sp.]
MRKCLAILALVSAFVPTALAGKKTSLGALKTANYTSIISTKDQTPRFTFHAPKGLNASHFIGGVTGVFMHAKAAERGSMILSEYKVTEPAVDIAKALAGQLGEELRLETDFRDSGIASSIAASHATLRSAKDLAEAYGPGRLVVNVGTFMWSVQGTGESKYRILYSARAQIVDTTERGVVASAECTFPFKRADSARDAATMFDNDAESLKAELQEIVEYCTDKLKSEMLGA